MDDSIHHKQLRHQLADQLFHKGIHDQKILHAIATVPRHLFIDEHRAHEAYEDKPLAIGQEQTISQPYTVAYQTRLLDVQPKNKVLEIGTGSGYQSAVLFELGAEVYSLERQEKLYAAAKTKLSQLGYSGIHTYLKDGNEGLPEQAPFDRIIVTAAAPGIPEALKEQLKVGGIMVIPVGGNTQKMLRIVKVAEDKFEISELDNFLFVPMLKGINPEH